MARAIVVFQNQSTHPLRSILKQGFRHVSVAIETGTYWVHIDPRFGMPHITVVANSDFDLAGFYREHGYTIAQTEIVDGCPVSPVRLVNCVSVVKAILGLSAPFAVTPYRLFKFLTRTDP